MDLAEPPGRAAGGTAPMIVAGLDGLPASGRRLRDPCAVETERDPAPGRSVCGAAASQPARHAASDAAQWKQDLPSVPNRRIWVVSAAPTVNDRPAPIRQPACSRTRGPPQLLEDHRATPANRKPRGCGGTRRSPGPVTSAAPGQLAEPVSGPGPFRRCPDDGMNPSLGEEHGEIPRRGQSPVAGLAAELASCPHGILGRPAPDSSAVLPDVHADRHAVSIGQLQRLGRDLFALGRVALLVQELEIPAAMRSAVNPGDDVIDRGAARRVRQVVPAPRAAPALQLHQFGHECQAVRCPRHNLVVMLAIASPGAKRPAAQPLSGRHRQPAHTAPARLGRHEIKLTRPVGHRGSYQSGARRTSRRSTRIVICCCRCPGEQLCWGGVLRTSRRSAWPGASSPLAVEVCGSGRSGAARGTVPGSGCGVHTWSFLFHSW